MLSCEHSLRSALKWPLPSLYLLMNSGFRDLLEKFTALGGIADNVYQRVGEYGRGVFPIDSSRMAKIMTPKNLLVNADNLCLDGDHVVIKDSKINVLNGLKKMQWKILNDEIATNSLRDANSDITVNEGRIAAQKEALESLSNSVATGRLVVPLSDVMAYRSRDIILKDGDRLLVPQLSQEVTILGEVRRPTSFLFEPDYTQLDYIEQSGGFKDSADKGAIFIVKAGGEIIIPRRGLFKFRSAKQAISPGDTIVVPLDADDTRIQGIPLLAEVSSIVYQLALGAAAIKSFNNN